MAKGAISKFSFRLFTTLVMAAVLVMPVFQPKAEGA